MVGPENCRSANVLRCSAADRLRSTSLHVVGRTHYIGAGRAYRALSGYGDKGRAPAHQYAYQYCSSIRRSTIAIVKRHKSDLSTRDAS